jgi:hypothetical protein
MRASWLSALAFVLGCGGPTLGDLETPAVSIVVTAIASEPDVAVAGDPQAGLGVERAFVSMSSLTLSPCREDASEIIISPRGYELVSPLPNAELVETAVTDLCGLRFDVDPLAQNAADGVPEGASLYVAGSSAAGIAYALASEQSLSLSFEVEADASFGNQPLLLGFDLSVWLADIPLEAAAEEAAQTAFETQLSAAVALYVDSNENHVVDAEEQTPVATAALAR